MLRCWFQTHRLPHSVPCLSILRDSRSQAYVTRPSPPKPFGLRVANLMIDLSIDPTLVYSFRLPRVGYWQLRVVSLCPLAMDGKKDFLPALSHTRLLEEEMANRGRNLENGRDHYFLYPSLDIHQCSGLQCTDFIGVIAHRSHVSYTKVPPDQGPSTSL
ncbi:hypothetical protein E2C01_088414 [Portunus trituberculatus]|uniref:Uncharacterized protein n=1 Tax=Portunus trituberculatus TaxID=210409 RepID=A0A5B7J963_PORTR|nr:hypothetical protein [Portunus trituberculatus]